MNQAELDVVIEKHEKWLRDGYGERANLRGANLSYADLSCANLSCANLRGANLRGANLSCANLRGANLSYADLSCANLRGANLRGANLSYADLSCANLRVANLSYADLSCANLRGANLSYADLRRADLNWINWRDVVGLTVIAVQINTTRKNNQITYIKELEIWTTGCFQGTLEELKDSIEQTHASNDFLKRRYYRAINYILTEADFEEDLEEENNEI
ncbi:pentapeptide repeat-containing protein [Listeria monocytogenes]|uniref:pentapeptide repeat-containing protein n=4 Tax=Listeria monocytogenes TaxID=1639 RepID=UPI000AAFB0DD|nr:pentapeptide repeat-containing protein [Listeria monocytogenes]MDF8005064.1 pentapeptide repeat-containing protein [Listeria monocytogenes]MDF8019277.1 pentapeptide repeat-containing protein [Listeria monocytogenes]MDF8058654.1 pentapeptide repeat-containing protein [Listeria monocytogenes]MDF8187685.1 pentapeptide repeat-containing protein [Listeria monocytogenes]MDF8196530.1 pentapeptide repeat-containing protein [Listeria monocytogenes]